VSGIVDAHNDLLLELAHRSGRGEANPFAEHWLPQLRRGGIKLQVCPTFIDLEETPAALRVALGQIAAFNRALRENPDATVRVRTREDLAAVAGGDRIGLMLSIEGAEPLGYDPWMAEVMFDLGVRMLGLTWNRRNPFADGVAENGNGGLSRLGRELVDLCGRLGIIIDLSHASERTFWDVMEDDGGTSVMVSHACCRALLDHPRNLSDDQLKALADRGGVLGLMLHPIVIDEGAPSIARAIDHLDHAVAVMGMEHVGLGGDFTRQVVRALGYVPPPDALLPDGMPIDAALEGLAGPEDYPNLEAALERRGYRGDRLEALLSGNLLRFLGEALPSGA
jgi:membrane dipeptidase